MYMKLVSCWSCARAPLLIAKTLADVRKLLKWPFLFATAQRPTLSRFAVLGGAVLLRAADECPGLSSAFQKTTGLTPAVAAAGHVPSSSLRLTSAPRPQAYRCSGNPGFACLGCCQSTVFRVGDHPAMSALPLRPRARQTTILITTFFFPRLDAVLFHAVAAVTGS